MPVLAVVGDVDPELGLFPDDVDRRLAQLALVLVLVVRLLVEPLPVQLDQVVGAREAAGVAGLDAIGRHDRAMLTPSASRKAPTRKSATEAPPAVSA
jgi:hypothetical protein